MTSLRIAVLISGNGSNLQAIIDSVHRDQAVPAEIVRVISNKNDVFGLERATQAAIPSKVIANSSYRSRAEFDAAITEQLESDQVDLICLAGFMRVLTEDFVHHWHNKIINIHPSLLPSFKGVDAIGQAFDMRVRYSGCTVHYVRPAVDEGPILAQAVIPLYATDDRDNFATRMHQAEHQCYPLVIRMIASGAISLNANDQVVIDAINPANIPSNINIGIATE